MVTYEENEAKDINKMSESQRAGLKIINETAVKQLKNFVESAIKTFGECSENIFDAWVAGYVSGASEMLFVIFHPKTIAEVEKTLFRLTNVLYNSDVAKQLGIKPLNVEQVKFTNVHNPSEQVKMI